MAKQWGQVYTFNFFWNIVFRIRNINFISWDKTAKELKV